MMPWWALALLPRLLAAATNVTVEDNDPRVSYTPAASWSTLVPPPGIIPTIYHGGTIHISYNLSATASLTFNSSTHVYVIGENNYDHGDYFVTLDGVKYPVASENSPQEEQQQMLFDLAVEPSTQHTISVTNTQQGKATVLDYFMYTHVDLAQSPAPSSGPGVTPSTTNPSAASPTTSGSNPSATSPTTSGTTASTTPGATPTSGSSSGSIAFAPPSSSNPPPSSPTFSSTNSTQQTPQSVANTAPKTPTAEIVAIAVAGTTVLIFVAIGALWLYRRRAQLSVASADGFVQPYIAVPLAGAEYSSSSSARSGASPALAASAQHFLPHTKSSSRAYEDEKRLPPAYAA